jgi:c-di-GMP-binding flagellar brake protein YcgR
MNWDHPASGETRVRVPRHSPGGQTSTGWFDRRSEMPDVTVERRSAPRSQLVLAADVVELPRGARLSARTADISRTGCYIDTLNPLPQGFRVRLRITHHDEVFEAIGRVVYVSSGLGMGVVFVEVAPEHQARLDRWLAEKDREF